MKKRKTLLIIFLFITMFFINKQGVYASKATCTYEVKNISVDIIYTYEYGKLLKYETTNKNKAIEKNILSNNDFVNQETGEIFCPKLKITSTTVSKGKWKISVTKNNDGTSGTLNILVKDDKEKNQPNSGNKLCNYDLNNGMNSFSLLWDNDKIIYSLSEDIDDYSVDIRNCTQKHFEGGCPSVHSVIVHKGKRLVIDCENDILIENEKPNNPDSSTDVDTGITTPNTNNNNNGNNGNNNSNVENIKNQFLGNVTCGGLVEDGTAFFTFPTMVPKLTSLIYNLLKIAIPVILVIMGMLDLFKSASAQKEDEMKKAQRKFVQRLIAGVCALLVFIIVETVINLIATKTGNDNAMDCVNCFINGIDHCASVDSDGEANK